jgi:hypothetical protein
MKRNLWIVAALFALAFGGIARADVIVYDSIPSPDPYNLPSLGYQANQTQEFGDEILLAGGGGKLSKVTLGMSSWAVASDYVDINGNPLPNHTDLGGLHMSTAGYEWPLTMNFYNVDHSNATPGVGSLIATKTITAFVPWDKADPNVGWTAPDGHKYSGLFFRANFDFTGDNITLPSDVIASLAFNTNTWGYQPDGRNGPFQSLNFAVASGPTQPTVGSNVQPDGVFWNTWTANNYADNGAGGIGTFRYDTQWTPYTPAMEITVVPLPAAAWMGVALLGALGVAVQVRSRLTRATA